MKKLIQFIIKLIQIIINISPLIIFLYLLDYVDNNLLEINRSIRQVQYYGENDTIMSQILNEVAANNTLLLFVSILLISVMVGIMIIILNLLGNSAILEELKDKIKIEAEQKID